MFVGVLAALGGRLTGAWPSGRSSCRRPSAILAALADNWSGGLLLQPSALATLYEAIGGLAIGTLAGVVVRSPTLAGGRRATCCCPIAIGASAIPIIAFAPILNNWFGVLNPLSKMMMAALLVFFPVMINVTRGLTQVDRRRSS